MDELVTSLWHSGKSVDTASTYEVFDPADPKLLVGRAARASKLDIDACIAAAKVAHGTWSNLTVQARAKHLSDSLVGVDAFRNQDAELLSREIGKTIHESWVDLLVFELRWNLALGQLDALDEKIELTSSSVVNTTLVRSSLGVVTIIVPFNWPLAILAASLPQALLAGNTVIVKAPRTAPLATTIFVQRIAAALPAGVLSVVSGDDDTMQPLIGDHSIAKVCFTGSVQGGQNIMKIASQNLTRLTLELGGNDPAIVLEDAELDGEALDRLFAACFDTSGQICMNVKRIYVHKSIKNELIKGLETRLQKVKLGHGTDQETTHGPLHTASQLARAQELLAEARATAEQILEFGELPQGLGGYFMKPALVVNPAKDCRLVVEEQFAPLIPVIEFESVENAIDLANDSWAGLGASVWGANPAELMKIAEKLQAGYIWINDHGAARLDLSAPFGGLKHSGFGKEQGIQGLLEFTELKAIARMKGDL